MKLALLIKEELMDNEFIVINNDEFKNLQCQYQ